MYRYGASTRSSNSRLPQTFLLLLVLALIIVSVGLGIAYTRATKSGGNTRATLLNRIQSEVHAAQSGAYALTQTSGSRAPAQLAAVRQHIYAIRTVNDLCNALLGSPMVNEATISACIAYLDEGNTRMEKGQVLASTYQDLRNAIELLQTELAPVQP